MGRELVPSKLYKPNGAHEVARRVRQMAPRLAELEKLREYWRQQELPKHLIISTGQQISGLEMMQHERLGRFVDSHPQHFVYYANQDVAEYTGPDAVIP